MIRCHAYRDRPAHVDMLHVDLWHKGVNVLSDSGSYKYYTPESPGLDKYFKDIAAHNTIEVDGRGPLDLASRFLWLPWPSARCIEWSPTRFVGEHDAYHRTPWNVTHRRSVELEADETWVITDDLLGEREHHLALRWHLAEGPYEFDAAQGKIVLNLPCGRATLAVEGPADMRMEVFRGLDGPPETAGWISTRYGRRTPRPTVKAFGRFALPARFISQITFSRN